MKCINKLIAVLLSGAFIILPVSGCTNQKESIKDAYNVYNTSAQYGLTQAEADNMIKPFAQDLCIAGFDNTESDDVLSEAAEGAGVFLISDKTASYTQNVHEKLYPASTTKILTAYIALKYGDLDQTVTVSEESQKGLDPSSSVCGVQAGDQLTLKDLLYGLMLCSGNDAAEAIAETISGSREKFADLMNQEALALGATDSHFVNAHGLPDEDHYTSVYDLYLIFQVAVKNEQFVEIINAKEYDAVYKDKDSQTVEKKWKNTNKYLTGEEAQPEGVTVIGGKTGTTKDAGYCLVLLSENRKKQPVISIVLKADGRSDLYLLMSQMLSNFSN
ncbi:D-alanyl-D-alanine carboxypeptidase dacB precursor [uncultured Roseburia sp.]|uniref:Serine hydrolase n=1 Tax=Brotonthovivens ammoniilytica TaxID=2981725 RepID=A0ABT2TGA4_9FIRM|nr:serine hydrolase [Brotonthovivens ammoniilytica]MCU6761230.1 serine hydrolase [Brotonthovivens ammoniilytica]SCI22657.1 D-alanyl-D-alanine carboxypeptidase dacB precursor [uncultured Roseburia sp.]